MRILVVDDEAGKRERIVSVVRNTSTVTVIDEARSFQSAMHHLMENRYDWIVLDMRLTSFDVSSADDGGRPRNFGGQDILRKILRRKISAKVVVLTQYSIFHDQNSFITLQQFSSSMRAQFPNLVDIIHFQHSNDVWETKLKNTITSGVQE